MGREAGLFTRAVESLVSCAGHGRLSSHVAEWSGRTFLNVHRPSPPLSMVALEHTAGWPQGLWESRATSPTGAEAAALGMPAGDVILL